MYFMIIKSNILYPVYEIYRIDKNWFKCREIPSQRRFVHNILIAPKFTLLNEAEFRGMIELSVITNFK